MISVPDAARAFREFFDELRDAFLERESLLTQVELALLCREHVLVTGPPGNAKSALASAVLERIVDPTTGKPSLFAKQISELTVQTDLIGAVDFKVLTETGRTEYITDDGMLGATHAFLDEVFDGRDMLLRSILNVLHERELKHGRKVTAGRTECVIMTSNRYLSEVLARSPELLLAFADRLSFIAFVPKSFARAPSRASMLARANKQQRMELRAQLSLQQLDVLQAAVEKVQVSSVMLEAIENLADRLERELHKQVAKLPDYVPTKYFSQRSVVKALWALKAAVVRDQIYAHPDRPLEATPRDLEALRSFFLLGGPGREELEALLKVASDPRERAQLEILRVEHKAFDECLAAVLAETTGGVTREAATLNLADDFALAEAMARSFQASSVATLAEELRRKLHPGPRHPENRQAVLSSSRLLLSGVEARLARGMAGQGEGRGGVQVVVSVRRALELARAVPELSARLPVLCELAAAFCSQALEMIALSAESAEFDTTLQTNQIGGLASNLDEEIDGIHELVSFLELVTPERASSLRNTEEQVRGRSAAALRRRVELGFRSAKPKSTNLGEALTTDARRLAELEEALVELSPSARGLKRELLSPLAREFARETLRVTEFTRLEQYVHAIRQVIERLRQEGLDPAPILAECHELVEQRVDRHVRTLARQLPSTQVPVHTITTGDAYNRYRQDFGAWVPDGEYRALLGVETALNAERPGPATTQLAASLKTAVAEVELSVLETRVNFLRSWLSQLIEALASPQELKARTEAERAFDQLVRSRFPMLAMKEGELVRIQASLANLSSAGGEVAQSTRRLEELVQRLHDDFAGFSRGLLDVRARL